MQLDLGALKNFQSDMSAAEKNGIKGKSASSRTIKQTGTASEKDDFQSNLNRAEAKREIDGQRSANRDEPVVKNDNRSSSRELANSGNKTQQDIQSTDDYHRRDRVLAENNNSEDVQEFLFASNGAEQLDSNFPLTLDSMVTDSRQANGASKEITLMPLSEGGKTTPPTGNVNPAEQIKGSTITDSGTSAAFNKENTSQILASATLAREISDHVKLDHTAKPSQTYSGEGVIDEMSENTTGPRGKELVEKTISEAHHTLTKSDHLHKSSDSSTGNYLGKTLMDEQAGAAQISKEAQKKMESISSFSNKAHADHESSHSNRAPNVSFGNPDFERLNRMSVEADRPIPADKNTSGQGEIRGSQDGTSASANKFNVDVEQNLKINDLISPSQRPVVGEVTTPPSTEHVEMRANIPKTDVLNQIVDRAVFKLNNEQSEVRIDLKPDFLGHVRLQIVTDSHQVNLRILAESSIVKELIDGNLGQLKNDLQSQGLKVDQIEVTVAKDFNDYGRNPEFSAHGGPGKRGSSLKDQNADESEPLDGHTEPTRVNTRSGGINCFA